MDEPLHDTNPRRIFLAGFWHETNTFAPGRTERSQFRVRQGAEVLAAKGDGSQLGAIVDKAPSLGWRLIAGPHFQAKPGGIVRDDICEEFLTLCESSLREALKGKLDGILLLLHGAMVSESHADVEGMVLREISRYLGNARVPVAVVIDPHANVTEEMAQHASILLSYRENPHTDAVETTLRACDLLQKAMETGVTPRVTRVPTPILWPPPGTASASPHIHRLLDIARAHEGGSIWAINVCPGFAHADMADAGLSFTIVHEEWAETEEVADCLLTTALDVAADGLSPETELQDAIEAGLREGKFPCLLVEPADNVGGGAPG